MPDELHVFNEGVNFTRYHGQRGGQYESFFLRANHPVRPLAFWIRYTLFSPKAHPEWALGELWAVFFDGETGRHTVVKEEFPLDGCIFERSVFGIRVGKATLGPGHAQGAAKNEAHALAWDLTFGGDAAPLLLLPIRFYEARFPAAKSVVSLPMARFDGKLSVDGQAFEVADWRGSQNHNWGTRHTDRYAWGQVAGFDNHPESFLEVATARLRLGPFWTPAITPLVLRHEGQEHAVTGLVQASRAKGSFQYFRWEFGSTAADLEIQGSVSAPREAFVGLRYYNPPGGVKYCLNTKVAQCTLRLVDRSAGTSEVLEAKHRAAFEILTDDESHGIPVSG